MQARVEVERACRLEPGAPAPLKELFSLPVLPTRFRYLPTLGTWNLRIEQRLGSNWLLSLGYFGNGGYHLSSNAIGRRPLNPAIYIPGQSTEANTQARRIDPNYSALYLYPTDLNSRYESFQVNIEKRFSKGFSLLANYTWSKAQDDAGPVVNPFDIRNFGWGNSTADLPNVFHLSAIWVLPHAPIKGWASKIVNRWEITGINSWQNGFRFAVYSGVDNSFSGVGNDRADLTGTDISQAILGDRSHGQMVNQYFTPRFSPSTPSALTAMLPATCWRILVSSTLIWRLSNTPRSPSESNSSSAPSSSTCSIT